MIPDFHRVHQTANRRWQALRCLIGGDRQSPARCSRIHSIPVDWSRQELIGRRKSKSVIAIDPILNTGKLAKTSGNPVRLRPLITSR